MRKLIPVAVLLSLLLMEIKQGSWRVDFSINSAERKVASKSGVSGTCYVKRRLR